MTWLMGPVMTRSGGGGADSRARSSARCATGFIKGETLSWSIFSPCALLPTQTMFRGLGNVSKNTDVF